MAKEKERCYKRDLKVGGEGNNFFSQPLDLDLINNTNECFICKNSNSFHMPLVYLYMVAYVLQPIMISVKYILLEERSASTYSLCDQGKKEVHPSRSSPCQLVD